MFDVLNKLGLQHRDAISEALCDGPASVSGDNFQSKEPQPSSSSGQPAAPEGLRRTRDLARHRLVNREARAFVDASIKSIQVIQRLPEALGATTPLGGVLSVLPNRWPRCTALEVVLPAGEEDGQAAGQHLIATALEATEGKAAQLTELSLRAAAEPVTLDQHQLEALVRACPNLRGLDLSGVTWLDPSGGDLPYVCEVLCRLPHLEELTLPNCAGLKHVGLLAERLTKLTVRSLQQIRLDLDTVEALQSKRWMGLDGPLKDGVPLLGRALTFLEPLERLRELVWLVPARDPLAHLDAADMITALQLRPLPGLTRLHIQHQSHRYKTLELQAGQLRRVRLGRWVWRVHIEWMALLLEDLLGVLPDKHPLMPPSNRLDSLEVEQLVLFGCHGARQQPLASVELRAVRELLARCDRVQLDELALNHSASIACARQAVELFGEPGRLSVAVGDHGVELECGVAGGRRAGAQREEEHGGTVAAAQGGGPSGSAGGDTGGDGTGEVAEGLGAPPAVPTLREVLRAWVDGAAQHEQRVEQKGPVWPIIVLLVGEGVGLLHAQGPGALDAWCERHVSRREGVSGHRLMLDEGAVAVSTRSPQAAEALAKALPKSMARRPLRALVVGNTDDCYLAECTAQALKRYLDHPGSSSIPLLERLEAVMALMQQAARLLGFSYDP